MNVKRTVNSFKPLKFLSPQVERKTFRAGFALISPTSPTAMSQPILHTSSSGDLKVPEEPMRARASSHSLTSKPNSSTSKDKAATVTFRRVFTEQQKELLRNSWNHVGRQGPSGIGSMIFKKIFEKNASIRRMFGYASTPLSRLSYDPDFEVHARLFVAVMDGVVRNMDDLHGKFEQTLIQYGRRHAKFEERGFKNEHWDVFAEAMTDSAMEWVGPGKHRETVRAWTVLVSFIIDRMRVGYDNELRRLKKIASGYSSCPHSPLGGSRNGSPAHSSKPSPTSVPLPSPRENGAWSRNFGFADAH